MFSSKPKIPVPTKDPVKLRQNAIAFLDKNYTRLKDIEFKNIFYMLEPNSINGIKLVMANLIMKNNLGIVVPILERKVTISETYKDKQGKNVNISNKPPIFYYRNRETDDGAMWVENAIKMPNENNAGNVVLGGRRRKSRRNIRKQRKTRRR